MGVVADGSFSYIAEIGNVDLFCSCDLHLGPITFIYELDPYFLRRGFRKLSSDIHTYIQTDRQTDRQY